MDCLDNMNNLLLFKIRQNLHNNLKLEFYRSVASYKYVVIYDTATGGGLLCFLRVRRSYASYSAFRPRDVAIISLKIVFEPKCGHNLEIYVFFIHSILR